jgi:hypothetical protein
MSDEKERSTFLRQEEGLALLRAVADKRTEDLVAAALTTLWQTSREGIRPSEDFDLRFFTQVLIAFCSKHELIGRILDGTYEDGPE